MCERGAVWGLVISWSCAGILAAADQPATIEAKPAQSSTPQAGQKSDATTSPAEEKKPPDAAPRVVNAETRRLARRFIGFGDLHFTNEKYGEAYQRYRKAAEVMPELGEAHFRQGFALIGSGRYELAAKAMRRGLALEPDWPRSGFRLAELYGGNQRARAAHLEALAATAERDPNNPNLLFLLGVCLFFDGARDRATPFFERVVQMAGQGQSVAGFLEPPKGK